MKDQFGHTFCLTLSLIPPPLFPPMLAGGLAAAAPDLAVPVSRDILRPAHVRWVEPALLHKTAAQGQAGGRHHRRVHHTPRRRLQFVGPKRERRSLFLTTPKHNEVCMFLLNPMPLTISECDGVGALVSFSWSASGLSWHFSTWSISQRFALQETAHLESERRGVCLKVVGVRKHQCSINVG